MTKISYKPLPGYLVVERLEDEPDPSGLVVSEAHRDKPQRGRVLAVWDTDGVGFNDDDPVLRLEVGEEILFRKYGPAEVEINGQKVLLLEQTEVYATLTREADDI